MKKIAEMLLLLIFFLLLLISAIFPIFTANNFWPFIFAIAFVYNIIYLEDLSPENGLLINTTTRTKMNIFVIGKDNTQNGALFLIGHDFYPRMP